MKRQYKVCNFELKAEVRWSLKRRGRSASFSSEGRDPLVTQADLSTPLCVFSSRCTTSQKNPRHRRKICANSLWMYSYYTQSSPSKNENRNYIFIYLRVFRCLSSGTICDIDVQLDKGMKLNQTKSVIVLSVSVVVSGKMKTMLFFKNVFLLVNIFAQDYDCNCDTMWVATKQTIPLSVLARNQTKAWAPDLDRTGKGKVTPVRNWTKELREAVGDGRRRGAVGSRHRTAEETSRHESSSSEVRPVNMSWHS